MTRKQLFTGLATLVLALGLAITPASAKKGCAPGKSGTAGCKNEIQACQAKCTTGTKKEIKKCKRQCKGSVVKACKADPTVCTGSASAAFLD